MKPSGPLAPVIIVASLLTLAACAPVGGAPRADSAPSVSTPTLGDQTSSSSPQAAAAAPDAVRVIRMEAKNFAFNPPTIQVQRGEKAVLQITSTQGDHAFSIPDLGIPFQAVLEGETLAVNLPTDKTGTFRTECGPMHPDMLGTLVVQ